MVRLAIILPLAGIFIIDTITHVEIAAAVFYVIVILFAVSRIGKRDMILLAAACILLTLLSFLLSEGWRAYKAGLTNLTISVSLIVITTYLALRMIAAEAKVHEARAQLLRVARLSSLGELTASIAHEVNQPLAALVTSSNACMRWLSQDPPNIANARRSVERIIAEGNRASEVILRIRGLFRSANPQTEWLDLNDVIVDSLALAVSEIERNGITLRLDLAESLPLVAADKIQLQQVVGNLLLNSIEAMNDVPANRRVIGFVSRSEGADAVVFSVTDSGTGLTPEARDRLFEAFWTTKEGGTGIGLMISRSIVEAYGGRIWSDPALTGGAAFHVRLPATQRNPG